MKKLIIAVAAVAVGIAANAASYTWSTTGRLYDGSGNTGADYYVKGAVAYLMFDSVTTQASLVESFVSDAAAAQSTVTSKKIASIAVDSEGKISSTASYSTTSTETAYFVIFANDKMYVSGIASAGYNSLDPSEVQTIAFGGQTTPSKATFGDTTTTYAGAGWYQAAAAPEPTSGRLLLRGVAGLARRRKRA